MPKFGADGWPSPANNSDLKLAGRLAPTGGGADGVPTFGADGWPGPANNSDLKLAGRLAPTAGPFHLPSPNEQQIFQSAPFERFDF